MNEYQDQEAWYEVHVRTYGGQWANITGRTFDTAGEAYETADVAIEWGVAEENVKVVRRTGLPA